LEFVVQAIFVANLRLSILNRLPAQGPRNRDSWTDLRLASAEHFRDAESADIKRQPMEQAVWNDLDECISRRAAKHSSE
jgi:hypothetical protein